MLSVIVVSYNTRKLLLECLNSLVSYLDKSSEIVVVDNNSQDGSVEMVNQQFPRISCVTNKTNLGFGTACNQGMSQAKGDSFWILNSDTRVVSSPQNVLEFMQRRHADIVGTYLELPNGTPQKYTCGYFFNIITPLKKLLPFKTKIWESPCPLEVDWVSGASIFLRRDVYKKTGGFDEEFFMYFEDQDFCLRAKECGFKVFYYPRYKVIHNSGGSFTESREDPKKLYYQSMRYFFKKHRPRWEYRLIRRLLAVWETLQNF